MKDQTNTHDHFLPIETATNHEKEVLWKNEYLIFLTRNPAIAVTAINGIVQIYYDYVKNMSPPYILFLL